ncbi:MAG: peptide chain release factor N(5)-glutamine methyltransferase [Candidatus Omnitrophota bacterium]|nr:peptide chain release factor N(5)-glutamine methyltransferase [Candidatus Omnitrophota bacterium]MDP3786919.1 peptide chain release factor N(5)-glutamine methyltransferase [Candidatus Omnitrophota bacterium]
MDSLEQLACWAFDCDRTQLYLGDYEADEEKMKAFHEALDSYARGVPAQYITGETEFMGLEFQVNPSVLIPRPETEVLVERVLQLMGKEGFASPYVLDLGTGSGAIAVSLTKHNPLCKIVASDISEEVLEVAKANAALNGVTDSIHFILSDLFSGIDENERFDLIISNPPYIPADHYDALPLEVKSEPRLALDGGEKGLEFYRKIIPESAKRLKESGYLVMEMGFGQSETIKKLADSTGSFVETEIVKDHNGINRVFFARKHR